jgi:hypothetical protein
MAVSHTYAEFTDPFELLVHLTMDHQLGPELISQGDMDILRDQHTREHVEEEPHGYEE